MKPWITYSLLRLGIFAGVFTFLMLAQVEWWLSALIAATVGFAISYIFFSKLRDAVALDLAARRGSPSHDPDREAEDAAVDAHAASQPQKSALEDSQDSELEGDRKG